MCQLLENKGIAAYCSGNEHIDYHRHVIETTYYDDLSKTKLLQHNPPWFLPAFASSSCDGCDARMYYRTYYGLLTRNSKWPQQGLPDLHYLYLKLTGKWTYPPCKTRV